MKICWKKIYKSLKMQLVMAYKMLLKKLERIVDRLFVFLVLFFQKKQKKSINNQTIKLKKLYPKMDSNNKN